MGGGGGGGGGGLVQDAGYHGLKAALAVIVFHFGVKLLVQFADILLPFIMALLLVTILDPVKQVTMEVLECSLVLLLQRAPFCSCCLRASRKGASDIGSPQAQRRPEPKELNELLKRLLLVISIAITVLLAGRFFWIVARIIWLSGQAVTEDFSFYQSGVQKRGQQIHQLLKRFHLEKKAQLDMDHMANIALSFLQYVAEFLTQHVFYTLTQVSLTTIFVLFLLYSPVQRDFSPVMRGVFESMELYLKLKTFISLMMGITNGIALAAIGLELPAAWGLLTFIANFIPNIGGPVMSILPCVIALLDVRKSIYQVSAAFLAQFFLHFNIANFVEPVVFGTTEEIHSVVVLLGLSFFGYIWGITGMFLSVPLLFAIHAWLDTIVRTPTTPTEPREDARFIMGILEGKWLADSMENDEHEEFKLLTGAIESDEHAEAPSLTAQVSGEVNYMHAAGEVVPPPPISTWQTTADLQALLAVRDPVTEEVQIRGLVLRWVLLAGAYAFVFFGFSIFHWDLEDLIHPSGQVLPLGTGVTPLNVSANISAALVNLTVVGGVTAKAATAAATSASVATTALRVITTTTAVLTTQLAASLATTTEAAETTSTEGTSEAATGLVAHNSGSASRGAGDPGHVKVDRSPPEDATNDNGLGAQDDVGNKPEEGKKQHGAEGRESVPGHRTKEPAANASVAANSRGHSRGQSRRHAEVLPSPHGQHAAEQGADAVVVNGTEGLEVAAADSSHTLLE